MPIEILMPALSPTMEEGTLAKWLVKEGDSVAAGDLLAEVETDKATMEIEATDEGVIAKLLVENGHKGVPVNAPIALLLDEGEDGDAISAPPTNGDTNGAAPPETAQTPPENAPAPAKGPRVFASPLARRIAAEHGLDLGQITGSGPHGRIIRADVDALVATGNQQGAAPNTPAPAPPPAPAARITDSADIAKLYADRDTTEIPLDGMRATIADRLSLAKQTIPHFYLRRDVQIDRLLALRADMNADLAQRGVKISVNDFIIMACARALQEVPDANAVWAGDRILRLAPSDIAVAVAVDGGLFTPVLRDAQAKSLSALSAEMSTLAERARGRKLAPRDYQGGSFAISNLGMYGIDSFDAIINPPHGAILAVGAGGRKPVVTQNGDIAVATVMTLSLSVDHRVIDGALGAQLMGRIVAHLQAPAAMLA